MVEIDGLLVETLAHADFAGFQTVEIGGNRQVYAVGQAF